MAAYGVTPGGNFEGKNILEFVRDLGQRPALAGARRKLFEAREQRVHPGRDEKVLTSWNGLMLAAFAEAARTLNSADYRAVAERNAGFLLSKLREENGRLLRTWKAGEAKLNGYLEDYAYLIEGLLELYQTTFDPRWFLTAEELAETMLEHFQAPGGFFDTSDDHETLITRPRDLQDNATPSGNAMAVTALLKLAGFTNDLRYLDVAHHHTLEKPKEIAIVADPETADTQSLLSIVRDSYRPFQVVALGAPNRQGAQVPLFQDRSMVDGQAAAYLCRDFACQAPVTSPGVLQSLLETG